MRAMAPMIVAMLLAGSAIHLASRPAEGGTKLVDTDDFTLELGMRIQPRMELERVPALGGGTEWQRDFMVRRTRIKLNGRMETATYTFEWKVDGTDQIDANPTAQVENAYVQYPLGGGVELRAGLYDQPFSRDRLTSDTKQLAVDRGLVSGVPDALGLADNATGFDLRGKVEGGRAEYAVGLFDNRKIAGRLQDVPMVVGRLDLNFGSTQDVFRDAHFGKDSWYSVGVNGSYQGKLENTFGEDDSSNAAGGLDGMIDIPTSSGRLFVRGEVNTIRTETHGASDAIQTTAWMLGCGVLILDERVQPIIRFDEVRLDDAVGGATKDITYLGLNFFQKGHALKLQGDIRLEANTNDAVDGVRLQAQLDF